MIPLLGLPALAQGFDAHGFNLVAQSGDVRDGLVVQRPGRFEQGDWFLGGGFEWAERPLVYLAPTVDGGTVVEPVLDDVLALNLSTGVWILDRWRLDAAVPLFLSSEGRAGAAQGVGLGDIRLASMVQVLRPAETGLGLGVVPFVDLPSGEVEDFLGQPGVAGGGLVAAGWEGARFSVGGEAGVQINPATSLDNLSNADALLWGLRGAWLFSERASVVAETRLETPLLPTGAPLSGAPAELTLAGRFRLDNGAHLVVGAATGLDRGASAALYRLYVGGGFGHLGEPGPRRPTKPEPASLVVSVVLDGATVDGADVVVDAGGEVSRGAVGRDGWVLPVSPGVPWTGEATWGPCHRGSGSGTTPASGATPVAISLERHGATVGLEVVDAEGALLPDARVWWRDGPAGCVPATAVRLADGSGREQVGTGVHKLAVEAPGFAPWTGALTLGPGDTKTLRVQLEASRIRVEVGRIVGLEPVTFQPAADVLRPESFPILDEVASTLKLHPELGRVEVAGHTDADGPEAANLDLSQRRAARVMAYLVSRGVDAARLTARGYGESVPVDVNTTDAGKRRNRRVEFVLLDQTGAR